MIANGYTQCTCTCSYSDFSGYIEKILKDKFQHIELTVGLITSLESTSVALYDLKCDNSLFFSLPSARQHPSYGDCLEVKREY